MCGWGSMCSPASGICRVSEHLPSDHGVLLYFSLPRSVPHLLVTPNSFSVFVVSSVFLSCWLLNILVLGAVVTKPRSLRG